MKHEAAVEIIAPDRHQGFCCCRDWYAEAATREEIQRLFDEHKANPFPAPDYRALVLLYYEESLGNINEHGNEEREVPWLREKCNSWLQQKGLPPLMPGEIEKL